jgi:hypothetical protein
MAVIQISKIQVRRGVQEELPQLSAGELGYSTDQRRLWIGNGVLGSPDYAPEIGNTEILTIYSPVGAALSNIAVLEANVAVLSSDVLELQTVIGTTAIQVELSSLTPSPQTAFTIVGTAPTTVDYRINRGTSVRLGKLFVTSESSAAYLQDEFVESSLTDINLSAVVTSGNVVIQYASTSGSGNATLWYRPPVLFNE